MHTYGDCFSYEAIRFRYLVELYVAVLFACECALFRSDVSLVTHQFEIAGNPRLEAATEAQLGHIRLMRAGLHWPEIDEHLSMEGLLRGDHGQPVK